MSSPESTPPVRPAGIRWWPLILVAVPTVARLFQIWFLKDYERQFQYGSSARVLLWALPAGLLWFLLASRLRWRTRLSGLGCVAAIAGMGAALFRIRGQDGDALPVVEFRYRAHAREASTNPSPGVGAPFGSSADKLPSFPQFQGPNRSGAVSPPGTNDAWIRSAPAEVWRRPVGEGWAGFAISNGLAISLEQQGDRESVFALSLSTGDRVWDQPYPARYANSDAGDGPRSVPNLANGRVYTAGATGVLRCHEISDGRLVWSVDLVRDLAGQSPPWGYSASPLVQGGLVWVPCGGPDRSLVALDAATGQLRLAGGKAAPAYASPMLATVAGHQVILHFSAAGLAAHSPTNGAVLFEQPLPYAPHVASPVTLPGGRILVSIGYGHGTFAIDAGPGPDGQWTNGIAWRSIRLKSKFANFLVEGPTIYGLDDGALVALAHADGKLLWKERRYGHGQLLQVGRHVLVSAEGGEIALVDVTPQGMTELNRFRALGDKVWNPPALAGNWLVVRNDREAACFRWSTP